MQQNELLIQSILPIGWRSFIFNSLVYLWFLNWEAFQIPQLCVSQTPNNYLHYLLVTPLALSGVRHVYAPICSLARRSPSTLHAVRLRETETFLLRVSNRMEEGEHLAILGLICFLTTWGRGEGGTVISRLHAVHSCHWRGIENDLDRNARNMGLTFRCSQTIYRRRSFLDNSA